MTPSAPSKRLLLSIHDVSPRFESQVDRLHDLLSRYAPVDRIALLVVPNHWGTSPITPGSPFATKLRDLAHRGAELFLHGYFHRDDSKHDGRLARLKATQMTAGEGEFLGIDEAAARIKMQAGKSLVLVDCGAPPPPGLDRFAHAGTLSLELSIGRERLIVNCGAFPAGPDAWHDALRATAAHSTLVLADLSSSEIKPEGLGRRPDEVKAQRQEANGAHWLEAEHDGWRRTLGAVHRRRLYVAESGEDIRGEDVIEASQPLSFTVRFHLHPDVQASVQQDGDAVLLRLRTGGGWRLRADGARLSLEESIYFGGPEPRRSEQVVLTGTADGPQMVKWAIIKVG